MKLKQQSLTTRHMKKNKNVTDKIYSVKPLKHLMIFLVYEKKHIVIDAL